MRKYFYFFRGNLETHTQFYIGWVNEARKSGLSMVLLTSLRIDKYFKKRKTVKRLKEETSIIILPTLPLIDNIIITLFFIYQLIINKEVIVHLKKRDPAIFNLLKKFFANLKYAIDLEGDHKAEKEFLIKHPYKEGFYDNIINHLEKEIVLQKEKIEKADFVFCGSENFKKLLVSRYPNLNNLENKMTVIPTGVDTKKFYYDKLLRKRLRKKLKLDEKFIIIYTGNAFYSWQNVYRTIEIYKLINKIKNAFLILLIREQDHHIVKEFINEIGLKETEYILDNIPNYKVPNYLNAADLGIVLRHNHLMNKISTPGKFGEYAACGLPILTTEGIANYSNLIKKSGYGIVLENMDDNQEIINKINSFSFGILNRKEYSNWSAKKFSNSSFGTRYVNSLKKI